MVYGTKGWGFDSLWTHHKNNIDFKQKEVISLSDGKILGFVVDVQADFENGEIHSIIVAKTGKLFGNIMSKNNITAIMSER